MIGNVVRVCALALGIYMLVPTVALAQSGIAGVVRDSSGGVLPGVTVEASSPALIEKTRTAITDGQGVYNITDLRPGVYSVTFSLPGFATVRRDGLDLPASFTATVNAEMRVGAVEETVTVTGESPLVDVRNVATQRVLQADVIEALPMTRAPAAYVQTLPGVTGYLGQLSVSATSSLRIHGSTGGETKVTVDGHSIRFASTLQSTYYPNQSATQDIVIQTEGQSAEHQTGGISVNVIPREGSNQVSGFFYGLYTGESLQASNLTDELRDRGLTLQNATLSNWDVNPAAGGPILRDRLWFFGAFRMNPLRQRIANIYFNQTPLGWRYTPDLSRPAELFIEDFSNELRLTTQVTPRNKWKFSWDYSPHFTHQRELSFRYFAAPEANTYTPYYPNYFLTTTWVSTLSNRLLFEAGGAIHASDLDNRPPRAEENLEPEVLAGLSRFETIGAHELDTGFSFRAPGIGTLITIGHAASHVYQQKASLSYVTGSHSVKVGFNLAQTDIMTSKVTNQSVGYFLLNGVPARLQQETTPWEQTTRVNADLGIYAQDQWTVGRATLNLGLRYDYLNSSADAQELPARRFVPAQSFAAVENVPNWHDLSPRLGVAYDVFGDGRTAVKANLSRFVNFEALGYANAAHGVANSVNSVTRTWRDANGDYVPDCDLTNPQANGECDRISNLNFGQTNPNATVYDPDLLEGYGRRGYNWTGSVLLQHQLTSGLSVMGAYHRRWFGNFDMIDNLAVSPADYDTYCVTAPSDSRLPGGGGQQICGLYDIKRDKAGQVQNFRTRFAPSAGTRSRVFDGIDLTADLRLPNGQLAGGVSIGREVLNDCYVVDSPQQHFCKSSPPFQPNIKLSGSYTLPGDIQVAAVLQNIPGPEITASRVFRNAEIAPSLGRNLSSGPGGSVAINLIEPGTQFADRVTQLDTRFTKGVKVGRAEVLGSLAVYNILNSSDVLQHNVTFGSDWLRPSRILFGRYLQLEAKVAF